VTATSDERISLLLDAESEDTWEYAVTGGNEGGFFSDGVLFNLIPGSIINDEARSFYGQILLTGRIGDDCIQSSWKE